MPDKAVLFPPSVATVIAGILLVSLVAYALFGGADYGGGVWDLLASGPRAREQRALVEKAIAPVWEANHVWLILAVTVLFNAFPPAFAAIATALHVPLTLMLVGVVLRGCAFTFRHYDRREDQVQRRWGRIFSVASVVTPLLLGVCVGAVATGGIRVDAAGIVTSGFVRPWAGVFPLAVGLFAVALFAFLAAVYLTVEADDRALAGDFRRRALWSAAAVGALAWGVFQLSADASPLIRAGLTGRPWSWPCLAATGAAALAAVGALWARRFRLARLLAGLQAALIVLGYGLAQFPFLVPPDIRIQEAAAPPATLRLLLGAIIAGAFLLFPSLFYLFRVFKAPPGHARGGRQ